MWIPVLCQSAPRGRNAINRVSAKICAALDSFASDAHILVSGYPSGFYRRCHY